MYLFYRELHICYYARSCHEHNNIHAFIQLSKSFFVQPSVTYGHTQKKCDMHIYVHTYIYLKWKTTLSRKRNGLDLCEGGENIGNSLLYLSFYIIHTLQYLTKRNTDLSKENVIPFLVWNIRFPEICISPFSFSFKTSKFQIMSNIYVRVMICYIRKKWEEVVFWTRHSIQSDTASIFC